MFIIIILGPISPQIIWHQTSESWVEQTYWIQHTRTGCGWLSPPSKKCYTRVEIMFGEPTVAFSSFLSHLIGHSLLLEEVWLNSWFSCGWNPSPCWQQYEKKKTTWDSRSDWRLAFCLFTGFQSRFPSYGMTLSPSSFLLHTTSVRVRIPLIQNPTVDSLVSVEMMGACGMKLDC